MIGTKRTRNRERKVGPTAKRVESTVMIQTQMISYMILRTMTSSMKRMRRRNTRGPRVMHTPHETRIKKSQRTGRRTRIRVRVKVRGKMVVRIKMARRKRKITPA